MKIKQLFFLLQHYDILSKKGQNKEEYSVKVDDRFIKTFSQGKLNVMEIWVDKETGVNYLYHAAGYGAGLTVLLDQNGKPVITPAHTLPY